ncbi:hypothetical protein HPB51_010562 [Rhipicephalus microplus]|uniref:Uncharacterized protein n=1 Tax=Rhipicephalus microplus TaxID=6941 RepID=A0A9J6E8P8_RHIMP|nr:hypothetical protein HPB51_010562 [Rhipicephalus microplus]
MAEEEIDMLCSHMNQVSVDQVCSLDDDNAISCLRLTEVLDLDEALAKARAALESCEPHHVRLRQMASAYCWLFPHNQRLEWGLFALDESLPPVDDFDLQTRIATALTFPGVDIGYVTLSSGGARYACAITAEQQCKPQGTQIVVGMFAWQGLPYLAISFPGKNCLTRVKPLLEGVLKCKFHDRFIGSYAGIDETLAQVNIHRMQPASDAANMEI